MIHIKNININIRNTPKQQTPHELEIQERINDFVAMYQHRMTVADMVEHLRLDPEIQALYPNN